MLNQGDKAERLRIVGTAVFPTVGRSHADHASLGVGAALPANKILEGLLADSEPGGSDGPNVLFVRLRPGVDRRSARTALAQQASGIGDYPYSSTPFAVQRPADIVNYAKMGVTPLLLAGGLAGATLVSLGLTLAAGVRRRRRDLAVLRSLGFTSGQLSATVIWQAAVTVVVGLLVGCPSAPWAGGCGCSSPASWPWWPGPAHRSLC